MPKPLNSIYLRGIGSSLVAAWFFLAPPVDAAHRFEGLLTFETYDRSNAVDFVRTVAFTVEVESSQRWIIQCVAEVDESSARSSPNPTRTVFKNQEQDLYVLTDFPDRQRTNEENRPSITRNLEIYREDFPPQDAFYTGALWLAYCASLPLKEVVPGRLRPVLNMNYELAREATMPYTQEVDHAGNVLQNLVFTETSTDSAHPWRAMQFRTLAVDFINGLSYVAAFEVAMYRAHLGADGILQEIPIASLRGTCRRAMKLSEPIAFPPLDERGPIIVTDDRLRRSGITNVTYLATNGIPLPAESQDLRERFERQLLRERRFLEVAHHESQGRTKTWAALLTILAVVPTIGFIVWRRKGSAS
ncbi:MAG: hypothetical protein KF833_12165 [Verrucomicrobiae bacterium]|nr:hypothetical protein [Verrucomicrobiae bacterium]